MSAELVRAAQSGDTMAMNDLLSELTPYLGRICGPIALDDGRDAVQETLIAIFRNLRSLRLSPEHRAVLVLRDLEGLPEDEAARLLQVPEGTVKSRLHRARRSFRKAWQS
ncbi:sigma factor-like helix-turn-helix DNA-binding protein [Nonomuraea sp. 3N208]|uniref:sigma factor-like helix-turn-helix DNA-binding protein n=1 Tax=Nonomuraea sp. 3N208 TaxID=3457421 RepID=UPI003FD47C5C